LEYLNLVASFEEGKTIKILTTLTPANKTIRASTVDRYLILDTGADRTAITKEVLISNGYGIFEKSNQIKNTPTGEFLFKTCTINGIKLANQFVFGSMKVDVLENWKSYKIVGVIGMDILSQMTFVISNKYKKFLLTNQDVSALTELFK
jgi:hypothetical protein